MTEKCKKCQMNEGCACYPDNYECFIKKKFYNKAIDDFTEKIKDANITNAFVLYQADEIDLAEFMDLVSDEIAEQLKS